MSLVMVWIEDETTERRVCMKEFRAEKYTENKHKKKFNFCLLFNASIMKIFWCLSDKHSRRAVKIFMTFEIYLLIKVFPFYQKNVLRVLVLCWRKGVLFMLQIIINFSLFPFISSLIFPIIFLCFVNFCFFALVFFSVQKFIFSPPLSFSSCVVVIKVYIFMISRSFLARLIEFPIPSLVKTEQWWRRSMRIVSKKK